MTGEALQICILVDSMNLVVGRGSTEAQQADMNYQAGGQMYADVGDLLKHTPPQY